MKIRKLLEEKVFKLGDVATLNLWGHFMDGVLEAYDEVCGRKKGEGK